MSRSMRWPGLGGISLQLVVILVVLPPLSASQAVDAGTDRSRTGARPLFTDAAHSGIWHGGLLGSAKAAVDTLCVYGGPGRLGGKFQTSLHAGLPDTQGWTGVDLTAKTVVHWHVSTYLGEILGGPGNHTMWCGELFEPCMPDGAPEGYGNSWDEWLDWYGTAPDNSLPTSVTVDAVLTHDAEPDYDYLYLQVERRNGWGDIIAFTTASVDSNGEWLPVAVDETFTVNVEDYAGDGLDQVHLRWRAFADLSYSDEDCAYPSAGLAVIDNVRVSFGSVEQTFDDFEPGSPVHWVPTPQPSVGDFSKVWPLLRDIDPCHENATPQWAFIDDGVVVPGTGGSPGVSWTYGPGGYVVNLSGGIADPSYRLHNEVWSPPIAWPTGGFDGALFEFDVYPTYHLAMGWSSLGTSELRLMGVSLGSRGKTGASFTRATRPATPG